MQQRDAGHLILSDGPGRCAIECARCRQLERSLASFWVADWLATPGDPPSDYSAITGPEWQGEPPRHDRALGLVLWLDAALGVAALTLWLAAEVVR